MRILIDARMMGPETSRGIGRYIEELVGAMLQQAPEHRYILVTRQADHPFASHPLVETIIADIPWYSFAEQFRLPSIFRRANPDIVHVPHWNVPLLYRGPLVATIHDLLLRHVPSSANASTRGPLVRFIKQLGYRIALENTIRSTRRILVPTQFVANDLRRFYPSAAAKLVVTGEGMPAVKDQASNGNVPMPFLLYVGSAYPHKGLDDLVQAWASISKAYPDLSLKIVGKEDAFMLRLKQKVVQQHLDRIEFIGYVDDAELDRLYRDAVAFVYPSHFEGFGLPPLEAIACGCPVIASDAGALREVLGEEGIFFFRVGSADGILDAVHRLMANPEMARKQTQKIAGKLAAKHSWNDAARKTLDAYLKART